MNQTANFGKEATDTVSGFKGTITGYVEYMHCGPEYLLSPQVKDDGDYRSGQWFDVTRVEIAG